MVRVGLISDTHGLLRPKALDALAGVDHIVHAGDVGREGIIEQLRRIAPVCAVRGNVDHGPWAARLPETAVLTLSETLWIYVLHNVDELDLDPRVAGCRVVVYGHSHRPAQQQRDGALFVNPGSAGPRRFDLPISLGLLEVSFDPVQLTISFVELSD